MNVVSSDQPLVRIRPSSGWAALRLAEFWEYRELLFFLTWREILVRYKQTVLGAAWAVIQPFFAMIVFSLFFGKLANMPSDGIPYPVWIYAALLPWQYFSNSLSTASNSLVGNANLIKKVFFPRLVVPVSGVLHGLVDFVIAFSILIVMMFYYQLTPGFRILLVPVFVSLALITSLGVSLWISALNVKYRDFRYVVPFTVQLWLFATPVVYPSSLLSEPWRTLFGLNPMVGVIEGFRWALLGTNPPGPMLLVSVVVSILVLISGAYYFRRMERQFADVI